MGEIKTGLGFPVSIFGKKAYSPLGLEQLIEESFSRNPESDSLEIWSEDFEDKVLIEQFVKGREFSCIVVQDNNGNPIALPPTEIKKGSEVFDYRSKYLPGKSRKITPMDLPSEDLNRIRNLCVDLFEEMGANVYARIDGFFIDSENIYLNDPNTTSGMMPSSFFFHQAAEIGLGPKQLITYIIKVSFEERSRNGNYGVELSSLSQKLDQKILQSFSEERKQKESCCHPGRLFIRETYLS